jgi:hypothetical protein
MREDVLRSVFSFLAAAVMLGMSQEWATWALEQRRYWKLLPAAFLAAMAAFEAHQVWRHAERIMGLSHE